MSFFVVAFPFPNSSLCFCQRLTRSFTWKSSHRSSIECDRPVKKHTKCLNWSSLLQSQLGIVLKMSKCTSIVILLGVLLQPHRFSPSLLSAIFTTTLILQVSQWAPAHRTLEIAGKILSSCKWNGMFPFRSVATKKVEQLRKISSGTPRSICISTGWTGNFGQMESAPGL